MLLSIIIVLITKVASGITLYISPLGNDANDGSSRQKSLATIVGARNKIRLLKKSRPQEKVIVIIGNGDYFITEPIVFTDEDGGFDKTSVTYIADKEANPVFYGGKRIKGFQKVTNSLWKVMLPEVKESGWNFEQLYVNRSRIPRARFPNSGFYRPVVVSETVLEKGNSQIANAALQKVTVSPAQKVFLDRIPANELQNAVVTFYHKWNNTSKKISGYNTKDTAFTIKGQGMIPWNKLDEKSLYTIENVKAALDSPGEWYLEQHTGYLYYIPKKGETPANTTFYAPVTDKFLLLQGTKEKKVINLYFENISFRVAGDTMPVMGNDPVQAAATVEATIMIDYGNNIQFKNCEIAHTGSNAIWFRKACSDSKVIHCYLHDLGAGGIKIGEINHDPAVENTNNIIVDNNIIHHGGYVFPCAVALNIFTGSDNKITHNEIADFRYSGISAGWVWGYGESFSKRNEILFNHIHHLGWGMLSDMGGVYTLGQSQGTRISNNIIHDVYSYDYGGWGLYTDEGSSGITMENNLVYNCKSSAFHQHYGRDNVVKNNIFYNQLIAQLEVNSMEPHIGFRLTNNIIYYMQGNLANSQWDKSNFFADSNAYWDTRKKDITIGTMTFRQWQNTGKDVHSIMADPGFYNAVKLDFRITNNTLIKAIGFKPFDYTQAGVYGDSGWKKKAELDKEITEKFNEIVQKRQHNEY